MVRLFLLLLLAVPAAGLTVEQAATGASADESRCEISKIATTFPSSQDNVFFRFVLRGVRTGDRLAVEWLDPRGQVHSTATYEELPAASSLCLLTALPIGGFPASQQPGQWTVRILSNQAVATTRGFIITGETTNGLMISQVTRKDVEGKHTDVEVAGAGFVSESVVNIARYKKDGGWEYIAVLLPEGTTGDRMSVRLPVLEPAEYLVIVTNPDGRQSPPARFLVSSPGGYKLPTPAGVPWIITQGPYGAFSHFGRSQHAWDIAPRTGACLVAMRAGTAYTFDLGLGQTPNQRIFGNYITVAHDDGEFSHYGHLKSGSFRVTNGQRVEQGQPLATAGNSGYTIGQGGGHHVHVHITQSFKISSPSIPFRFVDLPLTPGEQVSSMMISSKNSTVGDCDRSTSTSEVKGKVAVEEVWTHPIPVAPGAELIEVKLAWEGGQPALDLALVSPSGQQYARWAEASGWQGSETGPQTFRMARPEPGTWHAFVRGLRGNGEQVGFQLGTSITQPSGSSSSTAASRALPRQSQSRN